MYRSPDLFPFLEYWWHKFFLKSYLFLILFSLLNVKTSSCYKATESFFSQNIHHASSAPPPTSSPSPPTLVNGFQNWLCHSLLISPEWQLKSSHLFPHNHPPCTLKYLRRKNCGSKFIDFVIFFLYKELKYCKIH